MPHTPGPWKINDMPLPSRGFIRIGNDICHIPKKGKGKYYSIKQLNEETRANAKLIAQSPKLLEALQAIVARLNGEWDNPLLIRYGELGLQDFDVLRIAEQAIKEATE